MTLSECLARIPYREAMVWQARFDEEWEQPSRSDHYLMFIAREVRAVLSRDPGKIKISDFKLSFRPKQDVPESPQIKQWNLELTKAVWFTMTGYSKKGKNHGRRNDRTRVNGGKTAR